MTKAEKLNEGVCGYEDFCPKHNISQKAPGHRQNFSKASLTADSKQSEKWKSGPITHGRITCITLLQMHHWRELMKKMKAETEREWGLFHM